MTDDPLLPDRVRRAPDGWIALGLGRRERAIVRALVADLRDIVGAAAPPPGLTVTDEAPIVDDDAEDRGGVAGDVDVAEDVVTDPVTSRLYPDARRDDPGWSGRFRDMVRGDLDDGRRANIGVVEDTIDASMIDDRQAEAWLHVLNDVRLVMGTRLGVTDETEARPLDPEDPRAAEKTAYAYVGWLESQFVDVLAAALPPNGDVETPAADDDGDDRPRGIRSDDVAGDREPDGPAGDGP